MQKLTTAFALFFTLHTTQAAPSIQQVIGTSGQSLHKWSLDDIIISQFGEASKCCPKGTDFDGERCVLDGPKCDYGDLVDGKCVTSPICPVGTWNGQFCVSTEGPICPDGMEVSATVCIYKSGPVCKDGTKPSGDVCESKGTPKCTNPDDEFKGGVCVSKKKPICKDGSKPDNGLCVSEQEPICVNNSTWDKEIKKCVSGTSPTCTRGTFQNGVCVLESEPVCAAADTEYNPKTKLCHSSFEPGCSDDSQLVGRECVGDLTPACKDDFDYTYDLASETGACCPSGMTWDGETCFSTSGPEGCPPESAEDKNRCMKPSGGRGMCLAPLRLDKGRCLAKGPICIGPHTYNPEVNACVEKKNPECSDPEATFEDGKCISSELPQCPAHTEQKDNLCVTRIPPYCDGEKEGKTKFDGTRCVTIDGIGCEDPQAIFDGEECLSGRTPTCDEANGFFLQGGRCVSTNKPGCPSESVLTVDGKCVTKSKPRCKTGDRIGDQCVVGPVRCPKGYWDGKHCVVQHKPECTDPRGVWDPIKGKCIISESTGCGPGYFDDNGECVSEVDEIHCTDGSVWDSSTQTCIGQPPTCVDGHIEGDECVADKIPECGEGFKYNGKKCVAIKGPDCPEGFEHIDGNCILKKGPVCGYGQEVKNGRCILSSGYCMEFEFCPTYKPLL